MAAKLVPDARLRVRNGRRLGGSAAALRRPWPRQLAAAEVGRSAGRSRRVGRGGASSHTGEQIRPQDSGRASLAPSVAAFNP